MRPILGLALVALGGFAGWMIISGKWPPAPGTTSAGDASILGDRGSAASPGDQQELAIGGRSPYAVSAGGSMGGTR